MTVSAGGSITIKYDEANRILKAAMEKASGMKIIVAVAIVDARGDLVAAGRMDGARWWWIQTCQGKAIASVAYGVPSGELAERASNPVMQTLVRISRGLLTPSKGAVPIRRGDQIIGAVGVGGGTGDQDEEVAREGAAAL